MPSRAPDISKAGRVFRVLGILGVLYGGPGMILEGDLYLVGVLPKTSAALGAGWHARVVAGGTLALLAGGGLIERSESGRRLAQRAALLSSLFGLTSLLVAMSRADFSELLPTLGGFAFAAYACFLLGRPDIRAQFNVDSGSSGRQNFATVIFAVVAVVIFVTCYVELTTQAPDETSAAAGGSGATSAAAPGSGATFSFIARSASRRSSRRGSSGASAPERLSAPGRPDFATDARY